MKKTKNTAIVLSILLLCIGALVFSCLNAFNIVRIFKTSITLSIKNNEYTYDGKSLNALNYEIKDGSLIEGDEVYFVFNSEIKDAATYTRGAFSYNIFDKNHNNVTSSYDINEEFEDIVINKRDITFETSSKTFYQSRENICDSAKIIDGSLCDGHYFKTYNFGAYSDDGLYENSGNIIIFDSDDINVTNNYNIHYKYGVIVVYGNNELPIPDPTPDPDPIPDPTPDPTPDPDPDSGDDDSDDDSDDDIGGGDTLDEQTGAASAKGSVDLNDEAEVILRYKPYTSNQGTLMLSSPTLYGSYQKDKFLLAEKYTNGSVNPYEFIQQLLVQKGNYKINSGELEYIGISDRQYDLVGAYPAFQYLQNNDTYFIESNLNDQTIYTQFFDFDYYSDHAEIDDISFDNSLYAEEESKYSSFVYRQYCGVDYETNRGVYDFINKYNIWGQNAFEIARNLMYVYKNDFVYSLDDVTSLAAENPVLDFLNNTKKGRCQNFAEAAVVIYRCLGYPARPVIGYVVSDANTVGKSIYVTSANKHEQCQVYLDGKGWVTFEFTVASQYGSEGESDGDQQEDDDYSEYDFVIKGNDHKFTYDGEEHTFGYDDYKIIKRPYGDLDYGVYHSPMNFIAAGSYKNIYGITIYKKGYDNPIIINNQFKIKMIEGEVTINQKKLDLSKSGWGSHEISVGGLSECIDLGVGRSFCSDLTSNDVIKSFKILNYEDVKDKPGGKYNILVVPEAIYNTKYNIDVTNSYNFKPYQLTLTLK